MTRRAPEGHIEILGEAVPALGFGTWQITGEECERAVADALARGYRHIDTAQMYENEREVGRGIVASGVDRAEIFLVTKVATDNLAREAVRRSTLESLERLGTDSIDLLLVHWPSPETPLSETLGAMRDLQEEGRVRRIGVSNFPPSRFEEALGITEIFCNQVEYHPFLNQDPLLSTVRERGLLLTAYCPLARGRVAEDATIREIGKVHDKTPGQVALRWLIQQGIAAIPKASSTEHRAENIDIFDFSLSKEEMERISALRGEERLIDPEWAPEWERPQSAAR